MKKVLLINPPESKQDSFFNPPLGLLYLAGSLRSNRGEVAVLDGCLEGWEAIPRMVESFGPHIVGVTCLTPERKAAIKIAGIAKEVDPEILTVMGGVHPTIMDRQILAHYPQVDVAVRGEGERTIVELAKSRPLDEIDGITFRKNREVVRNRWPRLFERLDEIPFPAWDLVDLSRYPARGRGDANGIDLGSVPRVSVIFSRGCTGRCHFCSTWWIWRGWRCRSPRNMADEMELLYRDFGIRHFCFADDTMTVDRDATLGLCDEIQERNLKIAIHLTTRADYVDEEMLSGLKNAGCYEIAYGIESASQRLLDSMGKGIARETLDRAVDMSRAAGISTSTLLIVGNVGESVQTINETVDWVKRARPDQVGMVGGLWVLPGTKLNIKAKKQGLLSDEFWLTDEPYLVYNFEHDEKRLALFGEAVELRTRLVRPLWLNVPYFFFIKLKRRIRSLLYEIVILRRIYYALFKRGRA